MREVLERKKLTLYEEGSGRRFARTFQIYREIGTRGRSSICYTASHQNSGKGVLKEFYPRDNAQIRRGPEGQLIPKGKKGADAWPQFEREREEYLKPYRLIQELARTDSRSALSSFIPCFEIYYGQGVDANCLGSAYIWMPAAETVTFQKVCDDIHKHPALHPAYKLAQALRTIEALTECVQVLHSAGLIHRDIKPTNFGFQKRDKKILTETLSIFDLNSICFADADQDAVEGSAGYQAPEAGRQDVRSDIYSIGATLFSAVVVTDEIKPDSGYAPKDFDRLEELVNHSALIQASEMNSHPRLRAGLIKILRRCLCSKEDRYSSCGELLEDLRKTLYYVMPVEISDGVGAGEKWVLAEQEKAEHAGRVIPSHLYENPLYRWGPVDTNAANVLVIGFGNYGQKFLETCLQVGQMRDRELRVTVISKDPSDMAIYLQDRPELAKFFQIKGMETELTGEAYGWLCFETRALSGKEKDRDADRDVLQDIIYSNESAQYIFIALGKDLLNLHAARACQEVIDAYGLPCCVNFVWEGEVLPEEDLGTLRPVHVGRKEKRAALEREIDRMAFNVYLRWQKNLNLDYTLLRREFRRSYNYNSSVTNVLSLKYKLYGIDIDLDHCGYAEAARDFQTKIQEPGVEDELVYLEHRRWVTEKICNGWRGVDNLMDCALDGAKDQAGKRHACIRRSQPGHPLSNWSAAQWKNAAKDELDELDCVSVDLYRTQQFKAQKARQTIDGDQIEAICRLAERAPETWTAYQDWRICLDDIWNRNYRKTPLYQGLSDALYRAAEFSDQKKALRNHLKSFNEQFQPILSSQEYLDYKQHDVDLVRDIPFILTYSTGICLAVPYITGSSNAVFRNLAAATVANPARIVYLCCLESDIQRQELLETLPGICGYLDKKSLRASVEFLIIYQIRGDAGARNALNTLADEVQKQLGSRGGRRPQIIPLVGEREVGGELRQALENRAKGRWQLAVEQRDGCGLLGQLLDTAGIYDAFPHYRFDLDSQRFETFSAGCNALGYIPHKPYITAADIISFRQAARERWDEPEFFSDYQWLWRVYCENSGVWKNLCDSLKAHADAGKEIVAFALEGAWEDGPEPPVRTYRLPPACRATVSRLLAALKKEDGFGCSPIGKDSRAIVRTTFCEVWLYAGEEIQQAFQRLLVRPDLLAVPDALNWYRSKGYLHVDFVDLHMESVPLRADSDLPEKKQAEQKERNEKLLKKLEKRGLLYGLSLEADHRISLTFATRQIRHLLVTAGNILEIYVYHALRASGLFDDVVSSTVISRNEDGRENEFDCIVTKGFRSLLIECKAKNYLYVSNYEGLKRSAQKLSGLVNRFGVNAKAVLLLDSERPPQLYGQEEPLGDEVVFLWKDDVRGTEEALSQKLLEILTGDSGPRHPTDACDTIER